MDTVHEEDYNGFKIKIIPDDARSESPRDWDNLGTMICWHKRYNLGDKHQYDSPDDFKRHLANEIDPTVDDRIDYWENGDGWQRCKAFYYKKGISYSDSVPQAVEDANIRINNIINNALDNIVILPLYLYDHSGITIRTHPFSCRWDSSQVGYIYVTSETIRKEYKVKRISKKLREKVISVLKSEVECYDQYITGDVYGYIIEKDGEHIDSCWGYYGQENCVTEAKSIVDSYKEAA